MASYTQFLGRIVTVQYRAGDMLLSAYGSFVGDSGRSIFLEQHVEQRGKRSYFRWEIPYQYIHKIEETPETTEEPSPEPKSPAKQESAQAAAAGTSLNPSSPSSISLLSFPQRPKTV